MDRILDTIQGIASKNSGLATTKQIEEAGVSRPRIKAYVDAGKLVRVRRGYYALRGELPDEYVALQSRCSKAVFSLGTALYFWGLSDRTPHIMDMSVPQGTNVSRIKRDFPDIRFHYVAADVLELGKTETVSPQGGQVILYDKERCICDLICARNHVDMQLYTQAIKDHYKGHPNLRKLLKYGRQMGIENQIRTYMEVLT